MATLNRSSVDAVFSNLEPSLVFPAKNGSDVTKYHYQAFLDVARRKPYEWIVTVPAGASISLQWVIATLETTTVYLRSFSEAKRQDYLRQLRSGIAIVSLETISIEAVERAIRALGGAAIKEARGGRYVVCNQIGTASDNRLSFPKFEASKSYSKGHFIGQMIELDLSEAQAKTMRRILDILRSKLRILETDFLGSGF